MVKEEQKIAAEILINAAKAAEIDGHIGHHDFNGNQTLVFGTKNRFIVFAELAEMKEVIISLADRMDHTLNKFTVGVFSLLDPEIYDKIACDLEKETQKCVKRRAYVFNSR